ncbi:ATP-binding protein [Pelagibius sp.]|uniref:ATP-binding protein n=1 Tax=Pelagibius sp. TaxID=1931238 RepID=UPI00261BE9A5|nr:ATP-binding protein [Pelagibius sp.]
MAAPTTDWHARNQAYLASCLATVRARLALALVRGGDKETETEETLTEALAARRAQADFAPASAIGRLTQAFDLTDFEAELLVLCAGVELDPEIARLTAQIRSGADRGEASFAVALSALADPHWSAISPGRPLRYWRCLQLQGPSAVRSSLQIDERTLSFLLGIADLDSRLIERSQPLERVAALPPSQTRKVRAILDAWQDGTTRVIGLDGPNAEDRRRIGQRAAEEASLACHLMSAANLPADPAERTLLQRLWERESMMRPLCLVIEIGEQDPEGSARSALDFALGCHCRILLSARERLSGGSGLPWHAVATPSAEEQESLWRRALGKKSNGEARALPSVLSQFDLGAADIDRIGQSLQRGNGKGPSLWQRCRGLAEPRLAALAERLPAIADWDDLIVPEREQEALRQIAAQVRNRFTVYHRWAMAPAGARGRGVTALFSGPSGTGKTMAAEVLARDLDLDLYRVDLSAVVSKYIGETEKNLRRIFDAAEGGGVVLLFDEADALFGERSQVSDSHDRYANIEIAYLLQRMESFSGLSILTSNIRDAIDQAFLRRLRFLIDFPFPDRELRRAIWERAFPTQAGPETLNYQRLAQMNVAGGTIRNIALNAAFIAADQGDAIAMEHIYRAAAYEYAKMDRPLSPAETEGWS